MTASEWVAICLFGATIVFGVIGWLLIRVIGNLDATINRSNENQDRLEGVMLNMQDRIISNEKRITVLEVVQKMNGCDASVIGRG